MPEATFEDQIPPAESVVLVNHHSPLDRENLGPYLASAGSGLKVEFANEEFTVYRIR